MSQKKSLRLRRVRQNCTVRYDPFPTYVLVPLLGEFILSFEAMIMD